MQDGARDPLLQRRGDSAQQESGHVANSGDEGGGHPGRPGGRGQGARGELTRLYWIILTLNFISQDAEEFDDEDIATELMPELDNATAVSVTIAGQL